MMNPYCSICTDTPLEENKETGEFKCPSCQAVYHKESEIMKYQDQVSFSHDDEFPEQAGVSTDAVPLLAGDDDSDPSLLSQLYKDPKTKPNEGHAEKWD